MECFKCSSTMLEGYIQVPAVALAWSPKSKKKSMFARIRWQVDKDEYKLAEYSYFSGSKVECYRCPECGVMVISE